MRIHVSMAVAAALASMAAAQSEGFEPGPATPGIGPLPAGWTSVNNSLAGPGSVPNWQVRNDNSVFPANTGASFAWANYNAVPGANDISLYLMSPQVTIANGASISFWTRTVNSPAFPDRLSLVFNTTGSTLPADFTNVLLTVNPTLTTTGYPSTWTQYSATISGVSGSVTGRYAFHYNPTGGGPAGSNSDFIGVDDVLFIPAGSGNVLASNTTLGQGCIQQYASLYELFATSASFDLSNTGISFLATGSGYLVLPGLTAYVPPSATATALTLGDDAETSVALSGAFPFQGGTTTSLFVCSNGFVSVGSGNGTAYVPAGPGFLNAPQATWRHWHDYNPAAAGSGAVKFEEVGSIAYITWDGVYDFGGTGPASANTFQFQFDQATGNVHIVFQTISTGGNGRLVGYSPGGASADPGSTDLSAALPATVSLQQNDILPLALAATTRPITGANWDLSVNNVPATGVLGVDVFGLSDPGINDLFFLGAPGCGLRAALDVTNGWLVSGATHTYSLPVPNNPALLNLNLFTTSAVFQVPQVNALGAITANGIRGVVGNF